MQYKSVIAAALLVGAVSADTGKLGDAAPILDNPVNATYVAKLTGGAVEGFVRATAGAGGKGVDFEVSIKSVTGDLKPAGYHIHDAPVTTDCASTLAHLDPYQRGAATPCDATKPETCEVGDLAGKHGKIDVVPYSKSYNDLYASTKPGIGAFFGNRSIVIHAGDEAKTRIACANFVLEAAEESECETDDEDDDDDECDAWEDDEECEEEDDDEEDCDEDDDDDDHEPGKPHPSGKPHITATVTVTKPCDSCPDKSTVYITTTVCPEGELPTDWPVKPTHGSGKPPVKPTGHAPHPGTTGKPGSPAPSGGASPSGSVPSKNATQPAPVKPSSSLPATFNPGSGAASFGVSAAAALAAGLMAVMWAL